MQKNKTLLSLFSCGGGMDIGFEGGFKVLKSTINTETSSDMIETEDDKYYTLKENSFETIFANDIVDDAKTLWSDYFTRKNNQDSSGKYNVKSILRSRELRVIITLKSVFEYYFRSTLSFS